MRNRKQTYVEENHAGNQLHSEENWSENKLYTEDNWSENKLSVEENQAENCLYAKGKRIGNRFVIHGQLAKGGMSRIYLAGDLHLGRNVIVKISSEQELLQEAELLGEIKHPAFPSILDLYRNEKEIMLVMEYIDGLTLREYIEQKGPFSEQQTMQIGLQILDALIYLLLFAVYIVYNFRSGKKNLEEEESEAKEYGLGLSIIMILAGLAGLIFGGKLFVNNAVKIAQGIGASEKFIAITVLALGTSLPELVTCVVSAAKKKGQLALGNIVGSNVFNILLILGCSGIIKPLDTASLNYVDMAVCLSSVLLLFLFSFTSKEQKISKGAGYTMLALELAYMIYLFIKL